MAQLRVPTRLSVRLTSRRGAWISLAIVLVVSIALFGAFGRATVPAGNDSAPPNSESAQASVLLEEFPDAVAQSVLIVGSRTDGDELAAADLASMEALKPLVDAQTGHDATGACPMRTAWLR